jgi:hypothetical protein
MAVRGRGRCGGRRGGNAIRRRPKSTCVRCQYWKADGANS